MKVEYNDCINECKQILEHLENRVQHNMLSEIFGNEKIALMDVLEHE